MSISTEIQAEMAKQSVLMTIDELLEDKSSDYKDGFNLGMYIASEYQKALMEIYFKKHDTTLSE